VDHQRDLETSLEQTCLQMGWPITKKKPTKNIKIQKHTHSNKSGNRFTTSIITTLKIFGLHYRADNTENTKQKKNDLEINYVCINLLKMYQQKQKKIIFKSYITNFVLTLCHKIVKMYNDS